MYTLSVQLIYLKQRLLIELQDKSFDKENLNCEKYLTEDNI